MEKVIFLKKMIQVNDSIVEFLNDKYHKINQLSYENTFNYLYKYNWTKVYL